MKHLRMIISLAIMLVLIPLHAEEKSYNKRPVEIRFAVNDTVLSSLKITYNDEGHFNKTYSYKKGKLEEVHVYAYNSDNRIEKYEVHNPGVCPAVFKQ